MKIIQFISLVIVLVLGLSCEKVIDLPINDSDIKIVVEGVLKDKTNESYVKLSKSGTVYDDSGFEKISNAEVIVSDNNGNTYNFITDPTEEGRYIMPGFSASENTTYSLLIKLEGQILTAESSSRSLPSIDSITFTKESFFGQAFYQPSYHSVDNGQELNHYRLRIWVNNEEERVFYLGDDQFINGDYYQAPFIGTAAEPLDTVFIEMLEMDEAMYIYSIGLANEADNSSFSPAPANPVTNIQGGGIGFFGVFMTDTSSAIVP